jgi:hypothetical protein
MDSDSFDRLAVALSTSGTRRALVRLLAAVPLASGLFPALDPAGVAGKNGKHGKSGNGGNGGRGRLGPVTAIAGGTLQNGSVAADGTVRVWGAATVGAPPLPPERVPELTDVVAIAMGTEDNLVLRTDGTVWIWNRDSTPRPAPAPTS